MKVFLVSSSTTFAAIIAADRASRNFEIARDPARQYRDRATQDLEAARATEGTLQKVKDWGRENRYPIVTASWVASMGIALGLVGRNPYLSKAQKLVQARVYAQGLTLAVLIATAAFEVGDASKGKGRWETVKVLDPDDPEHKHLIEKRIHHEAYEGEDLWRGMSLNLIKPLPTLHSLHSFRNKTDKQQIWSQPKSAKSPPATKPFISKKKPTAPKRRATSPAPPKPKAKKTKTRSSEKPRVRERSIARRRKRSRPRTSKDRVRSRRMLGERRRLMM
jgi:hypothetical protein